MKTMKRDQMPEPGEHRRRWLEKREVFCGQCHQWRKQAEAQRQYRTPSPWVHVCNLCFTEYDRKARRDVPDAVVMEPVRLPPTMRSLWDLDEEED
jgi:hypothetical protein